MIHEIILGRYREITYGETQLASATAIIMYRQAEPTS